MRELGLAGSRPVKFSAYVARASPQAVIRYLDSYVWQDGKLPMTRLTQFLAGSHGDPEIDGWLIVAPQVQVEGAVWTHGGVGYKIMQRARTGTGGRYKVYTDPEHVNVARYLATIDRSASPLNSETEKLSRERQGLLLFYPVRDEKHDPKTLKDAGFPEAPYATIGFAVLCPPNNIVTPIKYGVRDESQPDAVVIDAA